MCCEKISVSDSKLFSQAATKWRMIGHLLKIPPGSLDGIGHDYRTADDALSAVFTVWSRTLCSPYSWKTILKVLATDAVGHRRLANDIARRLPSKIGDFTCFNTRFTSSLIQCVVYNPVSWDHAAIVTELHYFLMWLNASECASGNILDNSLCKEILQM